MTLCAQTLLRPSRRLKWPQIADFMSREIDVDSTAAQSWTKIWVGSHHLLFFGFYLCEIRNGCECHRFRNVLNQLVFSFFIIVFFKWKWRLHIHSHSRFILSFVMFTYMPHSLRFASPQVSSNFVGSEHHHVVQARTHQQCALSLIDVWRRRRTRINKNDERRKKAKKIVAVNCSALCACNAITVRKHTVRAPTTRHSDTRRTQRNGTIKENDMQRTKAATHFKGQFVIRFTILLLFVHFDGNCTHTHANRLTCIHTGFEDNGKIEWE